MPLSSESFKRLRINKGLSQQEFADAIGITREMVGQIERKQKGISKATEILVANYLGDNKVPPTTTFIPDFKIENSELMHPKDYRLSYESLLEKTNNQLSEAINSIFTLAKEIALSLTEARSDQMHFAQTQIDNQRQMQNTLNQIVEFFSRGQPPSDNPGSKSSLPDAGQ